MTPPHSQLSLVAALCAFVSLVQGAVSTLKMIFVRRTRECHTKASPADLPQATSSTSQQGTTLVPPGSRPAVDAQRRTNTLPDLAHQRILRDDRSAIPQDEAGERCSRPKAQEALILRDLRSAQIVSKGFAAVRKADELVRGTNSSEEARGARGGLTSVATLIKDKRTALSPLMPTNVGIQDRPRTLSRLAAPSPRSQHNRSWIPTLILSLSKDAGMSGTLRKQPRATSA